jgi:hypothetical protein
MKAKDLEKKSLRKGESRLSPAPAVAASKCL